MKRVIALAGIMIAISANLNFTMQHNQQLVKFTESILAPLNKIKEDRCDARAQKEIAELQAKYQAKKEKVKHRTARWLQMILDAGNNRHALDALYSKPSKQYPLLHKLAMHEECLELLKLMLAQGASPDLTSADIGQQTPLLLAAVNKAYGNISALLEYGAKPALLHHHWYIVTPAVEKDSQLRDLLYPTK